MQLSYEFLGALYANVGAVYAEMAQLSAENQQLKHELARLRAAKFPRELEDCDYTLHAEG